MLPNPQETADLVTFTEEIPNEKLHFLSFFMQCQNKMLIDGKDLSRAFCKLFHLQFCVSCGQWKITV